MKNLKAVIEKVKKDVVKPGDGKELLEAEFFNFMSRGFAFPEVLGVMGSWLTKSHEGRAPRHAKGLKKLIEMIKTAEDAAYQLPIWGGYAG